MINELMKFQKNAVEKLFEKLNSAIKYHNIDGQQQVIAFRAPTGSGKTIMMTSVIEEIFYGNSERVEQPEAVFIWLSDSPQLNAQSKMKIKTKSNKIRSSQCVTIDDSFDREILEDGNIYFLNTQKLGRSSRLVMNGDNRNFTIWQTLQNTAEQKGNYLYVIIDEAHRGMRENRQAAAATTIMQKFLKGSEADGLSPMPIVIGMSATDERFRRLVENINSPLHSVDVRPEDVRESGLLKDRIIITYPEQENINDMVILQAAADEWKSKCEHWKNYCLREKIKNINPVLVIQVENRNNNSASATEIGECISKIENRTGKKFSEYEVVHTFGQTGTFEANGIKIHHVDASDISDNEKIRIVFFKENLSTGWDCPRAETMMSFRHAEDATYIAQLLGRMIRTPLQSRVYSDDSLNDVKLFLPYFNRENVEKVMQELHNEEGGEIPADIESEEYGNSKNEIWTYNPPKIKSNVTLPGQISIFDNVQEQNNDNFIYVPGNAAVIPNPPKKFDKEKENPSGQIEIPSTEINREEIADFINNAGLITYKINKGSKNNYLESLDNLTSIIKNSGMNANIREKIYEDGIKMIKDFIASLKDSGQYAAKANDIRKLNLSWQIFDPLDKMINKKGERKYYMTSEDDIDRNFKIAEKQIGGFGLGNKYLILNFGFETPTENKIHVILFANSEECIKNLFTYAKNKFQEITDEYRLKFINASEKDRKKFDEIISNASEVSEHIFNLPKYISVPIDDGGEIYKNHLFVDEEKGYATIKLNSWEKAVIDEEMKRKDFVCWLRNKSRAAWALCLKRTENDEPVQFYPDFLVVRSVPGTGYLIDILEPHMAALTDNLSKAKALMRYMERQPSARIGRIQLIRKEEDSLTGRKKIKRLDFSKSVVKDEVKKISTIPELDKLFANDILIE